jgi:hypothetical protein
MRKASGEKDGWSMREKKMAAELIGEIKKALIILEKIDAFYQEFKTTDFRVLGKKKTSAIVTAEIIADFYTCTETLFLRISRFFENSLGRERWHSDLLHKMTLEIAGVRKAVISDRTYMILLEFMKFRHFKRYYFESDYDWDKLEFLEKKYNEVKPLLKKDIRDFEAFLNELSRD